MANAKFIEKWCLKKVKDIEKSIVYDLPKDIEKTARLHFNRAKKEIPAYDTEITVSSHLISDKSAVIECSGSQVLFVEFGAGLTHSTRTSTVVGSLVELPNGKTTIQDTEFASRPAGIVGIGEYGKGLGKGDSWIFADVNYIEDNGYNHTHLIDSKRQYNLYRTSGIRPVRALYLAVGSGAKKLTTKKIRRIG